MKKYKPLTAEEKKEKNKEYERNIANLFIKGMQENKLPWQKPWIPNLNNMDHNLFSMTKNGNASNYYKGINGLMCELTRMIELQSDDTRWATITQIMSHNKNIQDKQEHLFLKKGVHGLPIKFYSRIYFDDNDDIIKSSDNSVPENAKKYKSVLKTYTIFHASQIVKYEYDKDGNKKKDSEGNYITKPAFPYVQNQNTTFEPLIKPDELIKATGVVIKHNSANTCAYMPSVDEIKMVPPENFKSRTDYYATVLHELTHWTGHESRLNREEQRRYGENLQWRAKEELVAEIGSYLLAKECRIAFKPSSNNLSYVESWMQELKDDPNSIFVATKKAEEAQKYILSFSNKNKKVAEQSIDKNESKAKIR